MTQLDPGAAMAALVIACTGDSLTKAQADFLGCLFKALFACAPCFLENFMTCLRPPASGYQPGDRQRCEQ